MADAGTPVVDIVAQLSLFPSPCFRLVRVRCVAALAVPCVRCRRLACRCSRCSARVRSRACVSRCVVAAPARCPPRAGSAAGSVLVRCPPPAGGPWVVAAAPGARRCSSCVSRASRPLCSFCRFPLSCGSLRRCCAASCRRAGPLPLLLVRSGGVFSPLACRGARVVSVPRWPRCVGFGAPSPFSSVLRSRAGALHRATMLLTQRTRLDKIWRGSKRH